MTKLLTSTWMSALIGSLLYIGASVVFWQTPLPISKEEDHSSSDAIRRGASWDFINPEVDQLLAEIKTEKKSLEKREQQLSEMSLRLQSERSEMNQVTQSVHQSQMDFDKLVLRVQDEEIGNLKKLAKVYAAMSAEGAAAIFAAMDDTSVVKIMIFMKEGETAQVLEALAKKGPAEAKRAVEISERLRVSVFRNNSAK